MITWASILLAVAAILLIALLAKSVKGLINGSKSNEKIRQVNLKKNKTTYFLEDYMKDEQCSLCFGELEEPTLTECACGHVFHNECAELTGECPYCKATKEVMVQRPIRIPKCPKCGKDITGNICECGTVLPNPDGTFKCMCGTTVCVEDDVCKKCGARFAPKSKE